MSKNIAIGDFKVCKDAANQFYYVAKWCADRDAVDYMSNTFYPYAVNIAFSCELFMKAIMIFRSSVNEFYKGHNLKDLFDNFDSSDRQAITNSFANKYGVKTINEFLDESKDVFIDWRYALEKGVQLNLTGFEIFSDVLHDYVNNLGGTIA